MILGEQKENSGLARGTGVLVIVAGICLRVT